MSDDDYKRWQDRHFPNDPRRTPHKRRFSTILAVVASLFSVAVMVWQLLTRE